MSVKTFPSITPASINWSLVSNTQTFRSPLIKSVQTLELPGAYWVAEITFPILNVERKRMLSAFLVSLRGGAGRFRLADMGRGSELLGSGSGSPVVLQSLSNLPTAIGSGGWTPGGIGVLKAGDMIGFDNDELKMVMVDVDADGSGQAVIIVEPPFRAQPSNASSIVTSSPTCIMKLVDDHQTGWTSAPGKIYEFGTITCEEVLYGA